MSGRRIEPQPGETIDRGCTVRFRFDGRQLEGYAGDTIASALTAAGVRKIGNKALRDLFGELRKGRGGQHDTTARGSGGDHTDDTKKYEFGDPLDIHLHKTVMNAVERNGAGTPVRGRRYVASFAYGM